MQDFLTEIKQAESQAEEIINSAKKQASDILENTKKEIERQEKEIFSEADKFTLKAIEEKKLLGQFDIKELNAECEKKLKNLETIVGNNLNKAVSYILSAI